MSHILMAFILAVRDFYLSCPQRRLCHNRPPGAAQPGGVQSRIQNCLKTLDSGSCCAPLRSSGMTGGEVSFWIKLIGSAGQRQGSFDV
jgi:hypothetical protein